MNYFSTALPPLAFSVLLLSSVPGCDPGGGSDVLTTEDTVEACQDGLDNDGDGKIDCDDLYCQAFDICDEPDTSPGDTDEEEQEGPGAILTGLALEKVEFCQTVCSTLVEDGEEVEPLVPLLTGKPALMRFHVKVLVGWDYRSSWTRFGYAAGGMLQEEVLERKVVKEDSVESDLNSTFNYVIPADYMVDGFAFSFSMHEDGSFVGEDDGDGADPIWPATGMHQVALEPAPDPIRITMVPVRYNADGSGRLPELSQERLDGFADLFASMYPLYDVDFDVREVFDWDDPTWSGGLGWETLLMAITELRETDGADFDTYYYGLFMPADTLGEFCGSGCVLGLSHLVTEPDADWARVSIGLGFSGGWAAETMVHEVGHAHGLGHAPCGAVAGVDSSYPYDDGTVGVPGYDSLGERFVPDSTFDFMSYCDPNWVSDYHFERLFERINAVHALAAKGPAKRGDAWRTLIVASDGTVSAGPTLHPGSSPAGEDVEVEVVGLDGVLSRRAQGIFSPFGHGGGGVVLFPAGQDAHLPARIVGR